MYWARYVLVDQELRGGSTRSTEYPSSFICVPPTDRPLSPFVMLLSLYWSGRKLTIFDLSSFARFTRTFSTGSVNCTNVYSGFMTWHNINVTTLMSQHLHTLRPTTTLNRLLYCQWLVMDSQNSPKSL